MLKIVLYLEDEAADSLLCWLKAKQELPDVDFRIVRNVPQVIQWLNGDGDHADRVRFPIPDVLVLDLKMNEGDPLELLHAVRVDRRFRDLPVIIYSAAEPEYFQQAMQLGATKCLRKMDDRITLIDYLKSYFQPPTGRPD
jgi:CheY-like chemotaxis protein